MIGELIPTGVTFGTGRISVNDQFSGTAEFNDVEVSGNLSAGTGGVIYSGGTDLYNIFSTSSGVDYWTAGTGTNSIAQIGGSNISSGITSVAEGTGTIAGGNYSHSEGYQTTALGIYSHAEGRFTTAIGIVSHSEGYGTTASGDYSHSEGSLTTAIGNYSHSEGDSTTATGAASHAEGSGTTASNTVSHAEGRSTTASGLYSHAEGNSSTALGESSHAEGYAGRALASYSHAEGSFTTASGNNSHAEGGSTTASAYGSHAEGISTTASGNQSHAEGLSTIASGQASHAEGFQTTTIGLYSHAEGFGSQAAGEGSHAEGGIQTLGISFSGGTASGQASHAEGVATTASGIISHAEGYLTKAIGDGSHAEGFQTTAIGDNSHAGGNSSIASGNTSFIHSINSLAAGSRSVVLGGQNITGTTADTVYVPYLNIQSLAVGTSVNNLGVDSGGNVVVGSAGGGNSLQLTITGTTFVNVDDAALFFTGNTGTSITTVVVGGTGGNQTHYTQVANGYASLGSQHTTNIDYFYVVADQANGASLEYNTGSTVNLFQVTKSSIRASSLVPTFNGITYDIDYSSNYTNRSLVDKQYVDLAVASGGGSGVQSYLNLGTTGTTITWNVSGLSTNYEVILNNPTTLNLTNVRNGEYGTIIVEQDATGGRTITFGTVNGLAATHRVVNGGGGAPTLTSTASATDILSFTYNGSTMYWTVGNDYT